MEFLNMSAHDIATAVQAGFVKPSEVVEFFFQRCQALNPKINALISLDENSINYAKAMDKVDMSSKPLAGVPILVKDMLCTEGILTTAGSKMLSNFTPPYDSTVVRRLKEAGAIIIGKCNLDEFAMGSSNETSFFGEVKNPWNLDCVPGGSSGGSAAAVAARMAPISIGTDTGGSIRQPAAFCGVFGIKPTYGRVSRYGIVAFASSFDQAGPLSVRSVDSALVLKVIAGEDSKDGTCSTIKVDDYEKSASRPLRVGIVRNAFDQVSNADIISRSNEVVNKLSELGHSLGDVSIEFMEVAVDTYYLLAMSEASSNLSRYDGVRFGFRASPEDIQGGSIHDFYSQNRGQGFGKEVKRRIALGTYALSSGYFDDYFLKASKVRRKIQNEFKSLFEKFDILVAPVTADTAFRLGEKLGDPLAMYNNDMFTTSANLAGLPAASLPIGWDRQGKPMGVQLIANFFDEAHIFAMAKDIEENFPTFAEVPNV